MKILSVALLSLGLLASPAQAMMRADPPVGAPSEAPRGQVEQGSTPSVVIVAGKRYTPTAATVYYNRAGEKIAAPRLAEGAHIAFTVSGGGYAPNLKEVWVFE